ncbi:MAG: hypothetical protein BWX55_00212 [Deltaproteobacteria bacterium ADurb.Bin022]|nr:MAG: hypothetical protein BWX55_00212 [Deltaproteobacteria bacterium ADurb.Bin022]
MWFIKHKNRAAGDFPECLDKRSESRTASHKINGAFDAYPRQKGCRVAGNRFEITLHELVGRFPLVTEMGHFAFGKDRTTGRDGNADCSAESQLIGFFETESETAGYFYNGLARSRGTFVILHIADMSLPISGHDRISAGAETYEINLFRQILLQLQRRRNTSVFRQSGNHRSDQFLGVQTGSGESCT